MARPSDDSRFGHKAAAAAAALAAATSQAVAITGAAADVRPTRSDVTLQNEGVVLSMPGLADQLTRHPDAALARLRQYAPELRASDLALRNGRVVVLNPAFRRNISTIGDTNPGCNVNCQGACT